MLNVLGFMGRACGPRVVSRITHHISRHTPKGVWNQIDLANPHGRSINDVSTINQTMKSPLRTLSAGALVFVVLDQIHAQYTPSASSSPFQGLFFRGNYVDQSQAVNGGGRDADFAYIQTSLKF